MIQGEEITDSTVREQEADPHERHEHLELIKPQGGKSVAEMIANNLAAVEEQAEAAGPADPRAT